MHIVSVHLDVFQTTLFEAQPPENRSRLKSLAPSVTSGGSGNFGGVEDRAKSESWRKPKSNWCLTCVLLLFVCCSHVCIAAPTPTSAWQVRLSCQTNFSTSRRLAISLDRLQRCEEALDQQTAACQHLLAGGRWEHQTRQLEAKNRHVGNRSFAQPCPMYTENRPLSSVCLK